ncbi:Dihydropteroate synthase [Defluviimonas aquaemixtae]|uniref:Dihydropteroate synthase n=1 Tax=Albidovulum aquaemixtae TaxID=1542388 RepID=A0A2R8B7C6_9RHOB|nr:dihydropteroate synthase [Defluviimonas aquaemixtae]SPH18515.1 Dihydropteroate synthase [Defluviimonas aquaemixtae]
MEYFRPIPMTDPLRPDGALPLAGGWCWFDRAEVLKRDGSRGLILAEDIPAEIRGHLTAARLPLAGMEFDRPRLMGILNVTPDSFSDGGRFHAGDAAAAHARAMAEAGADILDIGGESTRPGAGVVGAAEEIERTAPVISKLRSGGLKLPISIDTRKAEVAGAALDAGADFVNDVAALGYDPGIAALVAARGVPLCLMHAQGDPATMQNDPRYDSVLLDVFDFLAERVAQAEAAGIPRDRIVVDPGIGFGKTVAHNLELLRGLSLFHGLGCVVLLGASRKRFIGTIGGGAAESRAELRIPGTIAVMLAGLAQGVQFHRVHDIVEAKQALRLYEAVSAGEQA